MIALSPSQTFEQVAQMSDHVKQVWLFDGQVVLYQVTDFTDHVTDEWCNIVDDTLAQWHPNQPMISIHDLRASNFTPYMRRRTQELAMHYCDLTGYSIVIVPDNLFGNLMRSFLLAIVARIQPGMTRVICKTMDEAMIYAHQAIHESPSKYVLAF